MEDKDQHVTKRGWVRDKPHCQTWHPQQMRLHHNILASPGSNCKNLVNIHIQCSMAISLDKQKSMINSLYQIGEY